MAQVVEEAVPAPEQPQEASSDEARGESPGNAVADPGAPQPGSLLWAKATSISEELWMDTPMPDLGLWVRVRYLPTPEAARLQFLPELADFTEMAEALAGGGKAAAAVDAADYAAENFRYMAWLVHAAVMDAEADPRPKVCEHCTHRETDKPTIVKHPPSLWTPRQCERLSSRDLRFISEVALRVDAVREQLPFSDPRPDDGSPQPATTGE